MSDDIATKIEPVQVKPAHVMRVMDRSGDTKIIWDSDKKPEVEAARKTFDELTDKGYKAYAVKKDGEAGEVIKKFDPSAEKIILAPPITGG